MNSASLPQAGNRLSGTAGSGAFDGGGREQRHGGIIDFVTPMVITFNEAPNIARTLDRLAWAKRILVVDSGSTDSTLAIVRRYPQARVVTRTFDSFAAQCNFGLSEIKTEWVLSLDADYELSDDFVRQLADLDGSNGVAGFAVPFVYRIFGRPLRGTLYPPRVVLYRARAASYENEGHGHRVAINGPVATLRGPIYHDDRKPLSRWICSQQRYAALEAEHLLRSEPAMLPRQDRLRLMAWPAPLLVLPYVLIAKGCLFDGWPGWFYALQRLVAECLLALELIEQRLRPIPESDGAAKRLGSRAPQANSRRLSKRCSFSD